MLGETRISRLFAGYRDVPATKREVIIDVLLALSDLARLVPDIAELDINPLLADAEGRPSARPNSCLWASFFLGLRDDGLTR